MLGRWSARLRNSYVSSREFVNAASAVIEEHKSLIWVVGTVSSALAGWAVYTSRRVHYTRIEDAMSDIRTKISDFEKHSDKEHRAEALSEVLAPRNSFLVVAPAVASAFLLGYMAGRTQGSYLRRRHHQVENGLKTNRVYVAVVPERLFEAGTIARELERAVAEADRDAGKGWRLKSPW
mmetsp:Transcript_62771/g.203390  ORF Transcript_62771/g.203390 Transcript_62771/m.203390 type:complete len:179 (+) Transcript_62771:66-602(+)